jgi:hypothetical protein
MVDRFQRRTLIGFKENPQNPHRKRKKTLPHVGINKFACANAMVPLKARNLLKSLPRKPFADANAVFAYSNPCRMTCHP